MPTLRKIDLESRMRSARRAALQAGHIMMAHYGKTLDIRTKSSGIDLVTHVDLEADEAIRENLREDCPDDVIITEETFEEGQAMDLSSAWIVDPLDGTTNYAHGFPQFAVSIAYVEDGIPKLGLIYDPFKNEMFTASEKAPAMRNGRPIQVSITDELPRALLATGFPYNLQSEDDRHNNISLHSRFLKQTHGIRRAGAAALDLAYVACGRLDGFWEFTLSPWDVAAGMIIIEKAGGRVSDFFGNPLNLSQRRIDIVGSNTRLHEAIVGVTSTSEN